MNETLTAPIAEIFASLQGEGLRLGDRQIFVRFAGCPWRCVYCDTPQSLTDAGFPRLRVGDVLERIDALRAPDGPRGVSLTGGEPVLRAEFLEVLLPAIRARGLETHLETSATHPALFKKIARFCDVVAADIKLPSAVGRDFWEEHRAFFELAGAAAFAKLVLTTQTTEEEFNRSLDLLAGLAPVPPLILQPVTAIPTLESRLSHRGASSHEFVRPPSPERVAVFLKNARARLPRVVVVPQMHPVWGVP